VHHDEEHLMATVTVLKVVLIVLIVLDLTVPRLRRR
jgi:hypothetical protein